MEKETLKIIEIYWDDELGAFHLNKVHDYLMESKKDYSKLLYKYCKKVYDKSAEDTERRYNQELKKISLKNNIQIEELATLFKPNQEVTDTLENKVFQAADSTLNRVDKNISKVVSESYYSGVGLDEITRNIAKEYNSLSTWEAERIARTEINCASNAAAFDSYVDLGVDFNKWWTGEDNNVRDSHRSLHGKIVRVGSKFSNGLMYPGDRSGALKEWINCRCTTVPFIMPLGKMAPPGMTEFTESDLVDIPGYHPISVEDALNANYPLEYWTNGGVFEQARTVHSPMMELTDVFKAELRGVVDDADLDQLSKELARFHLSTNDLRYERLSVWDSNGKSLMEFHTNFTEDMVYFPPSIGRIGDTKGFKSTSHNHTKGFASLHSTRDILQMSRSEYGFNTSYDDGLAVLTHKKGYFNGNLRNLNRELKDFDKRLENDFKRIDNDYYTKIKNAKDTGKISQETYDKAYTYRFNRFIKQNETRYYEDLNNILRKHDMEVKHIPQSRLPNNKYVSKVINESKLDIERVPEYDYNNAYMGRTGTSELTEKELMKKLKEVLNPGQRREYVQLKQELKALEKKMDSAIDENDKKIFNKDITNIKVRMDKLESLTYEEPKLNNVPKIIEEDYVVDNQVGATHSLDNCDLEIKQINHQKKIHLTKDEILEVNWYGRNGFKDLNEYLNQTDEFKLKSVIDQEEIIKDSEEMIEYLDSAMDKSLGLVENTKLFRYGYFDVDLNPGDKCIWKAYTSTSFQRRSAEAYGDYSKYYIEIFANKNTKGLALNDDRINGLTYEHEYLLPRNQEYQVLEVDHINKTVKVLLL